MVALFVSQYLSKYLNKEGMTQIKNVKYTKVIKRTENDDFN